MGGYTYSETRAGYEVANSKTNWEVVVGKICFLLYLSNKNIETFLEISGGSHLITPKTFLNNLKHLENIY